MRIREYTRNIICYKENKEKVGLRGKEEEGGGRREEGGGRREEGEGRERERRRGRNAEQ
jgi:hypothetical protein